ncbi:enoyl-hydratase isomerase family protein [Diplodia corticola]|uniref:Enoyl-hydratase isomerase family protein n=1 Tax=Diplodia corticola TaxID=236234 RepID=A0A1J9QTC1_9PEZI|nr:enoyl-hydratase isomerase family protein [Diplodia corticola]OJD31234.1 enoyl-hydratase isomerase family protein [Diplodia corticola]
MFGRTNDPLILSPLEQAGHRGYARPILCFALNPSYVQDEVVRILQEGLSMTKEQVPYLAAEVVPDDDPEADQKGCLGLQETADLGELRVKRLDKTEFPLTYDEFRAKNFPIDLLLQDVFSPLPIFPTPGDRVPVFAAQANFIEGGLLLSICSYHLVADGFSIAKYLQLWAQNCRKVHTSSDGGSGDTVFLSSSAFDRAPLLYGHLSDPNKCDIKHHPELVLNDTPLPQTERIPSIQRRFRARIWHFTPDAIARLRADATAPGQRRVSMEEAVSALLWRCTVAAQIPSDAPLPQDSIATLAVPSRSRTFPHLAPDYMGCPLVYASAVVPLGDILNVSGDDDDREAAILQMLATTVKAEIDSVTAHRVATLVNTLQSPSMPDYQRLAPVSWAGLGKNSVFISKWNDFPFYDADWGVAFNGSGSSQVNGEKNGSGVGGGGYCERVRTVSEGVLNGVQMILPPVPRGTGVDGKDGVEVLMAMEEGRSSEALASNPVWLKYALPA